MESKRILQAVEKFGFEQLNTMQLQSIESIKSHASTILLSPTGSGKTLAFLLPMLYLIDEEVQKPQILILSPSRELAIQTEGVFKKMQSGYKICCCYGGHQMSIERNALEGNPHVVIGTPGRILSHIKSGHLQTDGITTLVLDEFDKALEFGFHNDMSQIAQELQHINKTVLISATESVEIPDFIDVNGVNKLNFLTDSIPENLQLKKVVADRQDKLDVLFRLLCYLKDDTILIFCNHRDAVDRISDLLKEQGMVNQCFHGGMEQTDRERTLIKFKNGSSKILISTDLASRGLDIPLISHIVHYQLPQNEDAFIHRNGRTARMLAEGTSYLVLAEDEQLPEYIQPDPECTVLKAEYDLPNLPEWETLYISKGKKDKLRKIDIVGFLSKTGNMQKDDIGLIDVRDFFSYVAIKRDKIRVLLKLVKNEKIKKMKALYQIAY